jgi:hypothetical protein
MFIAITDNADNGDILLTLERELVEIKKTWFRWGFNPT